MFQCQQDTTQDKSSWLRVHGSVFCYYCMCLSLQLQDLFLSEGRHRKTEETMSNKCDKMYSKAMTMRERHRHREAHINTEAHETQENMTGNY